MLQDLIKKEERFQAYLLNSDYTFIGPENNELLNKFVSNANEFTPVASINRSIHDVLSNKNSVRIAINLLPDGTILRIFVVTPNEFDDVLLHDTIENYCKKNNINYPF